MEKIFISKKDAIFERDDIIENESVVNLFNFIESVKKIV